MLSNQKLIISTQMPDQFLKLESLLKDNFRLVNMPMIKIEDIEPNPELLETIRRVNDFDWIIFTSMRGIHGFFKLLNLAELNPNEIKNPKFACIGKATNSELKKFGFNSSYINPDSTSKEFSARLIQSVIEETDKVLLPLGERADTFLTESLQKVCQAKRVNVYKTIDVEQIDNNILSIIEKDEYGILVFTSPSAFDNFIKLTKFTPESNNFKIATIGKKTSEVVKKAKFNVMLEAKNSTIEGLADEIIKSL